MVLARMPSGGATLTDPALRAGSPLSRSPPSRRARGAPLARACRPLGGAKLRLAAWRAPCSRPRMAHLPSRRSEASPVGIARALLAPEGCARGAERSEAGESGAAGQIFARRGASHRLAGCLTRNSRARARVTTSPRNHDEVIGRSGEVNSALLLQAARRRLRPEDGSSPSTFFQSGAPCGRWTARW